MSVTFRQITDALVGLIEEINADVFDGDLHIHRWGYEQAHLLPAAWLALDPSTSVNEQSDGCSVTDDVAIYLKIAVEPTAGGAGGDMETELEDAIDGALPIVDRAMRDRELGVNVARRSSFQIETTQLGNTNALTLVLALSISWRHPIPDPKP